MIGRLIAVTALSLSALAGAAMLQEGQASPGDPPEPARIGQPAYRRDHHHHRIQPARRPRSRAVRRARAVGSRLVPRRGHVYQHRALDRREDRRATPRGRLVFRVGRAES